LQRKLYAALEAALNAIGHDRGVMSLWIDERVRMYRVRRVQVKRDQYEDRKTYEYNLRGVEEHLDVTRRWPQLQWGEIEPQLHAEAMEAAVSYLELARVHRPHPALGLAYLHVADKILGALDDLAELLEDVAERIG
jgi:hypothetical protein